MYKVFVDNLPIILSTRKNIGNLYFSVPIEETNIAQIIKKVKSGELKYVNLYHYQEERLLEYFEDQIELVNAGGGLVHNENDDILFIFRRGKWDIPKGKAEKGESIEETALREVQEETGIKKLKITDLHPKTTYHIMEREGVLKLKKTSWFTMKAGAEEKLMPQTEEEITKAEWLNTNQRREALQNTYGSIRLLFPKDYNASRFKK